MKKYLRWVIGLIMLGCVITGFFLELAPDTIPAHYNLHGEVDRWGSKYEFFVFPICNMVFAAAMLAVAKYEKKQGREMNERVVGTMTVMVLVVFQALWTFFMRKAIGIAEQTWSFDGIGEKAVTLLFMASLIPIGNMMPKAEMNSLFGLRTKWSMANENCWQKSQRLGGYVSIVIGILGVALISLCPASWAGVIGITLILIMLAVCLIGSYRIYKRDQG